ncbi:MAG TPA: hypothetical protein PKE39_00270 [Ignavibacteria bacterium]|nr:hypothetical protein [Ignavibacteria bacterium]HMQ97429.1 hypothetical protein [Ignavibacteria bacterium]
MKKTKLISLLGTFSKQEILRLDDFVKSPFFNKNKNVINLCEAVLPYWPGFESPKFTEENIFRKIFPNENFDYFKIKNVISDLYALTAEFLKVSISQSRPLDSEINLLNALHDRRLDNIYSQREKKVKQQLRGAEVKDEDNYLRQYQLERVNIAHYKFSGSSYSFNSIQTEFDSFLEYSLTGLLRLYSKMLHNKNHGNIQFDMKMFENVWQYAKEMDFSDNPSCLIYKQVISLELSKSEADYRKLLEIKEKYRKNIPPEEYYYILQEQNSYSAYRLKLGDENYYVERFRAFREMVEKKFMDTGYLIFPNVISAYTSACMANEYEWAEDFLKKAQSGISPKEEKLNTINYCKGYLAYRQKDFGRALQLFSKTNFKLYLMKVMVKSYSARIYYEQNLYEQTISAVDTFRHYLKTEKMMAEEQKNAHYEFLRNLTELARLKFEGINKTTFVDLAVLKKQIKQMSANPLGAKNWLIEKAGELK